MTQLVLNPVRIPGYLKGLGKNLPFKIEKVLHIKELSGGNVSYIYRVIIKTDSGRKTVIIKQAAERIKKKQSKLRVPLRKIITEARLIEKIGQFSLKKSLPEVYFFDSQNYLLIMSDVSLGKKLLARELKKNHLYPQLAADFGKFFGRLHSQTLGLKEDLSTAQKRIMEKYYIPVHLIWGAKKHFPFKKLKAIINKSYRVKPSLVWLDPIDRNIFVNKKSFNLIDFDFCLHLDPAMDLGIFLSHWSIKTQVAQVKVQKQAELFIKSFTVAYKKEWLRNGSTSKSHLKGILKRVNAWLGIYLLSRVDGKNGSYVQDKKVEEKVRDLGKNLVNNKCIIIK